MKEERKTFISMISEKNSTICKKNEALMAYEKADGMSGGLKDNLISRIRELNKKVDGKELLNQELTRQIEELNKKNELLELKNQELADYIYIDPEEIKDWQAKINAQNMRIEKLKAKVEDLSERAEWAEMLVKNINAENARFYRELVELREKEDAKSTCNCNKTEDKND